MGAERLPPDLAAEPLEGTVRVGVVLSRMSTADNYRRQAADAQKMADRAISPLDKAAWLRIARGFQSLVSEPPRTEAEQFTDVVEERGTNQDPSTGSH